MNGSRTPVIVFVLSEVSPVLVERWIAAGKLPFLAEMARTGSSGRLRSNVPLITVQTIADLLTGQRAQNHGVFDYIQRQPDGRFGEVSRHSLACPALWDLIEAHGRTCGVVNLPLTWPPKALNGYMISGQDAPANKREIAAPAVLYDELVSRLGSYRLKDIFPGGREKHEYLPLFAQELQWQSAAFATLLSAHPTDFFIGFVSAPAMAQHYFWSDMDAARPGDPYAGIIESVYRQLDAELARLAGLAGPEARIIVISECGSGPIRSGVNINAWLHQQGLLHYKRASQADRWKKSVLGTALTWAKRALPEGAKALLGNFWPGLKASAENWQAVGNIDWQRTSAYSRGKEGAIFLNLVGREPHGVVSAADRSRVTADIVAQLQALKDPNTGKGAVAAVHEATALYPGNSHPGAPDLIIDWVDAAYMPTEANRRSDQVFGTRWRAHMKWPTSGSHRIDGILYARGPGIAKNQRVDAAGLLDMLPTWLHLLGIPVPAGLPGQVLAAMKQEPSNDTTRAPS